MINTAEYRVELRLDGALIGDVRGFAQNLSWTKARTRVGVDEIMFEVNDVTLSRWLVDRGYTLNDILRPLALDCRVVRNGVAVVGGFLATMPSYSPNGTSADLTLQFDGYLNFLDGVNIAPRPTEHGHLDALIQGWIAEANARAEAAGKGFGITAGDVRQLAIVDYTFSNYKTVKSAIVDRCDNVSGAGPFDLVFHPDRSYDIIPDTEFGDDITDYVVQYPAQINGVSATSLSAPEVSSFASSIIGIGAGETSDDASKDTAITSTATDHEAVLRYGYREELLQWSSISVQTTLDDKVKTALARAENPAWQPQIKLSGVQVNPAPSGDRKIWIGDRVTLENAEDLTGMTSGVFRVDELAVSVSAQGGETITPTLSNGFGTSQEPFIQELVSIRRELRALKTAA